MSLYREKVFPSLAAAVWFLFLILDLTYLADSTWLKFGAICLCFASSLTGLSTPDGRLTALAQGLTVCADLFLLVLNRSTTDQLTGVVIFLSVQLLYALRLRLWRRRGAPAAVCGRLAALAACAGAAVYTRQPLAAVSLLYFVNLCVNTAAAFSLSVPPPRSRFAWGLVLFVGCDVCVGAWNLGLGGAFPRVGMWLFYLPSQVLIVLSQEQCPHTTSKEE